MDFLSALVAYLQPTVAVHPRESSFHNPPVSTQLFAGFDAPSGDAWGYAPLPQSLPASREVVALVGMQLLGALAWASTRLADRRDSIHRFLQELRVVDVCSRMDHRERDASSVDHNMALGALLSLICRILTGLLTPRGRPHSPSLKKPSASRSDPLLLSGPRAFDAALPTRQPRATP
jgi:hypothetical protein